MDISTLTDLFLALKMKIHRKNHRLEESTRE